MIRGPAADAVAGSAASAIAVSRTTRRGFAMRTILSDRAGARAGGVAAGREAELPPVLVVLADPPDGAAHARQAAVGHADLADALRAIAALRSDACAWITGEHIEVSGGFKL